MAVLIQPGRECEKIEHNSSRIVTLNQSIQFLNDSFRSLSSLCFMILHVGKLLGLAMNWWLSPIGSRAGQHWKMLRSEHWRQQE